jgi:hypothetical protein
LLWLPVFLVVNAKSLRFFISLCFGCTYFLQHKVTELFSYHCAFLARIFGNAKSLHSFFISLCFGCTFFLAM